MIGVVRCDNPQAFYVHTRGKPELGGAIAVGRIDLGPEEAACITGFWRAPRDCDCGAFRLARLTDPPFSVAELPALKAAALAEDAEWIVKRLPQRDQPPDEYGWHIRLSLADPRLSTPLVNAVALVGGSPIEPGPALSDAIRLLRMWAEEAVLRRLDLLPPEEPE